MPDPSALPGPDRGADDGRDPVPGADAPTPAQAPETLGVAEWASEVRRLYVEPKTRASRHVDEPDGGGPRTRAELRRARAEVASGRLPTRAVAVGAVGLALLVVLTVVLVVVV